MSLISGGLDSVLSAQTLGAVGGLPSSQSMITAQYESLGSLLDGGAASVAYDILDVRSFIPQPFMVGMAGMSGGGITAGGGMFDSGYENMLSSGIDSLHENPGQALLAQANANAMSVLDLFSSDSLF